MFLFNTSSNLLKYLSFNSIPALFICPRNSLPGQLFGPIETDLLSPVSIIGEGP